MIAALLTVFLIASDSAATSNVTQAPPSEEAATAAPEAPKKICKRQPVTGQIQGTKRICMTAEQWKAAQQSAERGRR